MERKNFIIGILVILLGASAYFNFQKTNTADKQQVRSTSTSQLSADDLFQKKQDCQKYKSQIEKKLEGLGYYVAETQYQSSSFLEKIFYSPKINTCAYVVKEWGLVRGKLTFESLSIFDALTGEILSSTLMEIGTPEVSQRRRAFDIIVKEYEETI